MRWLLIIGLSLFLVRTSTAATVEHVIHISVDGTRGDLLKGLMETEPGNYPNFNRLRAMGACTFNARCDFAMSVTLPNHTSMLTGRPVLLPPLEDETPNPLQHGYLANWDTLDTIHENGSPVVYKSSTFDVVHDRGFTTALFAAKTKFSLYTRSYDALNGKQDMIGPDNGRNKIDVQYVASVPANIVMDKVLAVIADHSLANYTFLHFYEPDLAGHMTTWGSPTYNASLASVDVELGRLLDAIEDDSDYDGNVGIILSADHGGGGGDAPYTHVEPGWVENCTIPFFVVAPGFAGGTNAYQHFSNRFEPAADVRPDYSEVRQPLRNGDGGNLAMALLGLPYIPGSSLIPELAILDIKKHGGQIELTWPAAARTHVLEYADNPEGPWTLIIDGITETGGKSRYLALVGPTPKRFWRLRKL